jgi:hypothetical protein
MDERLKAFERILGIMDDLRAQCPWDKAQTMETLRHLTIEEVVGGVWDLGRWRGVVPEDALVEDGDEAAPPPEAGGGETGSGKG